MMHYFKDNFILDSNATLFEYDLILFEVPNYTFDLNMCPFVTKKLFCKKSIGVLYRKTKYNSNVDLIVWI